MKIKNLEHKKAFYATLNESQKRHFIGLLEQELPHGAQSLLSNEFEISRNTIRKGIKELRTNDLRLDGRVRAEGGGSKKKK